MILFMIWSFISSDAFLSLSFLSETGVSFVSSDLSETVVTSSKSEFDFPTIYVERSFSSTVLSASFNDALSADVDLSSTDGASFFTDFKSSMSSSLSSYLRSDALTVFLVFSSAVTVDDWTGFESSTSSSSSTTSVFLDLSSTVIVEDWVFLTGIVSSSVSF